MSSRKYHISPETGRPNLCTATVKGCKYAENGQEPEHYATKEEAREAYSKKMESEVGVVQSFKKSSNDKVVVQGFPKFDSTTADPVEFDNVYSVVIERQQMTEHRQNQAYVTLQNHFNPREYNKKTRSYEYTRDHKEVLREILMTDDLAPDEKKLRTDWLEAKQKNDINIRALSKLESTYSNRGSWNRAFVVPNGHVHKSMGCSTCNKGEEPTKFQLLTDYSGKNEGSIVKDAGYRACTTCYPSAPVGDSSELPTKMFSDEEKKKSADRAEKAQVKEAKKVEAVTKAATLSGEPLKIKTGLSSFPETFKTERSALNWYMNSATNGKLIDNAKEETEKNARYTVLYNHALKHDRPIGQVQEELHKKALVKSKKDYKESLKHFEHLKEINRHSMGDMKPLPYEEPQKDDYGIPKEFLNKSPRDWDSGEYIPR